MERHARREGLCTGETASGDHAKNPKRLVWHLKQETFRKVTRGDHSGSGSSKVVLYCVYSVR